MRAYNFSAGPSALPLEVMTEVQAEFLDWQQSGASALEISHRSPAFMALYDQLESDLREVLTIPDDYTVILSSGGASAHFAFLPLNLLGSRDHAAYVISGAWSEKAYHEGCRYGAMRIAASSSPQHFHRLPHFDTWQVSDTAAYCHLVSNETIHGVQYHDFPQLAVPLVVDMSSDILSKPLDIRRFGVVYAGAQKNIGPAGLTLLIIHRDLLGQAHPLTPTVFNYTVQAANQSMANTPPTFAWYITAKVLQHIKRKGGLTVMAAENSAKAACLYTYLDQSALFRTDVDKAARSTMNIPFFLPSDALTQAFLAQATARGLVGLKGHRLIGGLRASLYNAVSLDAVQALVALMAEFEAKYSPTR